MIEYVSESKEINDYLDIYLNQHAEQGWRLHTVIVESECWPVFIWEREVSEEEEHANSS